jgi:hypothetical protein
MYVPGLMDRVSLVGRDEVYLVTRVDYDAQVADLLPMLRGDFAVPAVPFEVIEAILLGGSPDILPN